MRTKRKESKKITALLLETFELILVYLNQQVGKLVEENIAAPIKAAGYLAAKYIIVAVFLAMAAVFITVGSFLLLVELVGSVWVAFMIVGAVLLLIALLIARLMRT